MDYQLFLITNDFTAAHVDESFHATVVAPTEAAARWIVAQQHPHLGVEEVRAAAAFVVGKIDAPAEGIISFEYGKRNRFPLLDLKPYRVQEEFVEVELIDGIHPERGIHAPVPGAVVKCFASVENPRIIMIRSTIKTSVPTVIEGVGPTCEATALQFYTVHSSSAYKTPEGGAERFTTEYINLFGSDKSILLARTLIIRNTELAYQDKKTADVLRELQEQLIESTDRNHVKVEVDFYPGQNLAVRDMGTVMLWAMSMPQIVTLDRVIHEDYLKEIRGTRCVTLNTGE